MKNITVLNLHAEPYPHDKIIGALFLWMFPHFVKPNHITVFRFIATPFVFWLLAVENWKIGLPVFILVAFSDALDGTMARMRKQVTPWGTLFDPLADKLLIGGAMFIFILKYINVYIGAAIIALEFILIVGGALRKKDGIIVAASQWGKIKMLLQVLGVSLVILSLLTGSYNLMLLAEWTLILSIGFAVWNLFGGFASL